MKDFEQFSFLRHGPKLKVGEKRKPLEESELSSEQRAKWQEAMEDLKLEDPELAYEALPRIEQLAREIFSDLPKHAMLIFVSSEYSRTKMTSYLLSKELMALSNSDAQKDIMVSTLYEPAEEVQKPDSLKSNLAGDIMPLMEAIRQRDYQDDEMLRKYFEEGGDKSVQMEDELVMKTVNEDLAGEDSHIRKRAVLFREQYEKLKHDFRNIERPVFFYGVTHHSALVALDVGFNGRERYESADEIPKPLSLWKANLKKKS